MLRIISILALLVLAGCSHKKVEVSRVGDSGLSCNEIGYELVELKALRGDIEKKTGFSGRNVGMGLLFWPGVIVNEYNAGKAEDLAMERSKKLVSMFEKKKCSEDVLTEQQRKYDALHTTEKKSN